MEPGSWKSMAFGSNAWSFSASMLTFGRVLASRTPLAATRCTLWAKGACLTNTARAEMGMGGVVSGAPAANEARAGTDRLFWVADGS